jgi:hypothetical protein
MTLSCRLRAPQRATAPSGCDPRNARVPDLQSSVVPGTQVWLPETTDNGVVLLRTRVRATPLPITDTCTTDPTTAATATVNHFVSLG